MRDQVDSGLQRLQAPELHHEEEKRLHPDRVEYRKYCSFCRKHTAHKETR